MESTVYSYNSTEKIPATLDWFSKQPSIQQRFVFFSLSRLHNFDGFVFLQSYFHFYRLVETEQNLKTEKSAK